MLTNQLLLVRKDNFVSAALRTISEKLPKSSRQSVAADKARQLGLPAFDLMNNEPMNS